MEHQRKVFYMCYVITGFGMDKDLVRLLNRIMHQIRSVLLNYQIGENVNSTVMVREGCFLSPVIFNIFLERIL